MCFVLLFFFWCAVSSQTLLNNGEDAADDGARTSVKRVYRQLLTVRPMDYTCKHHTVQVVFIHCINRHAIWKGMRLQIALRVCSMTIQHIHTCDSDWRSRHMKSYIYQTRDSESTPPHAPQALFYLGTP